MNFLSRMLDAPLADKMHSTSMYFQQHSHEELAAAKLVLSSYRVSDFCKGTVSRLAAFRSLEYEIARFLARFCKTQALSGRNCQVGLAAFNISNVSQRRFRLNPQDAKYLAFLKFLHRPVGQWRARFDIVNNLL